MMQEYQNILIPVDGSKEAEVAFEKAVATAKRNNAHLDLLNIIDTRTMAYNFAGLSASGIAYELVEKSTEYLNELAKQAKDQFGFENLDIHVRMGNPKTVIATEFVANHHNDLIMIGASGMTRFQRAMIGSTTSYVKRVAPVDVLVVRTPVD
ncbi:universal stress protein [Limosilactobacillus equigenerosi]|nr:universal stress protein [Limosilactobacillus equigenerosi]